MARGGLVGGSWVRRYAIFFTLTLLRWGGLGGVRTLFPFGGGAWVGRAGGRGGGVSLRAFDRAVYLWGAGAGRVRAGRTQRSSLPTFLRGGESVGPGGGGSSHLDGGGDLGGEREGAWRGMGEKQERNSALLFRPLNVRVRFVSG